MVLHREPLTLLLSVVLLPFLRFFAHNLTEGILPSDLAPYFAMANTSAAIDAAPAM